MDGGPDSIERRASARRGVLASPVNRQKRLHLDANGSAASSARSECGRRAVSDLDASEMHAVVDEHSACMS